MTIAPAYHGHGFPQEESHHHQMKVGTDNGFRRFPELTFGQTPTPNSSELDSFARLVSANSVEDGIAESGVLGSFRHFPYATIGSPCSRQIGGSDRQAYGKSR